MITKRQAELSAAAYSIMAAGERYEFRMKGNDDWHGPFGISDLNNTGPFNENVAEVREYAAPPKPLVFYAAVDTRGKVRHFNNDQSETELMASNNDELRVIKLVETPLDK